MRDLIYNHGADKKSEKKRDSYYTPRWFTLELANLIGDYLDPCPGFSDPSTVHPVQSGLEINWRETGLNIFINPPFSQIEDWIDKANLEADQEVFTLYFGKLDYRTKWGASLVKTSTFLLPILGYVRYLKEDGSEADGAPFQSCIAGFGVDSAGVENKCRVLFNVA